MLGFSSYRQWHMEQGYAGRVKFNRWKLTADSNGSWHFVCVHLYFDILCDWIYLMVTFTHIILAHMKNLMRVNLSHLIPDDTSSDCIKFRRSKELSGNTSVPDLRPRKFSSEIMSVVYETIWACRLVVQLVKVQSGMIFNRVKILMCTFILV